MTTVWMKVLALAAMLVAALLATPVNARIHHLELKDESRRYFIISSFGLLQGGSITIQVSDVHLKKPVEAVGFTVHRNMEAAIEYTMDMQDTCIFSDDAIVDERSMRFPFTISDTDQYTGWGTPLDDLAYVNVEASTVDNTTVQQVVLSLNDKAGEDIYTVAFHICAFGPPAIDAEIRMIEVNPGPDYLGAGLRQLPIVYGTTAALFGVAAVAWAYILWRNRSSMYLYKIHYMMLALVCFKVLSSTFHAVDYHFISTRGTPDEGWAITYYVINFARGMLLFLTVLLVGVGYGFIKRVLSSKEKRLFMIVLPLQVFANVAAIVLEEAAEGSRERSAWRAIGFTIDLICCGAILFPIVWSIDHLQSAAEIDGKAAVSLQKLRLFRRFYVLMIGYIYLTRIIIYFMASTVPFRYRWVTSLLTELLTLGMYMVTGSMFSPHEGNDYVRLARADEEDEQAESYELENVMTHAAPGTGVRKVNRPRISGRDAD
ncbi:hypothetical protein PTSG_12506 [Salpingoeca rosetta]|uniref:GOST seven transmembrane domain-containing protein n=1 Tax=Salpingoeca rosetta (strain ATCC 50818 / BSB-021) TaxID=946362 RepID=F2UF53_SALR5|nr:uncharacterized protein PTSG_12506 [Salpingoeca rosetta]EGD75253.1 hypothetical protein PTSG_12506 [Salpingoeca rosetta]|eukprot:XP_004992306.1 hypothetical protein PTSG_12506 [Salpingoeca rosetta]